MSTLKGRLRKNSFLFFLKKSYPKNFAEMLARIKKYVNIEGAMALHEKSSKVIALHEKSPVSKLQEKKVDGGDTGRDEVQRSQR